MFINFIKAKVPDLFIKKFGTASATLARLTHVNQVQLDLANAAPYTVIGGVLEHPLGQVPTISIVSATASRDCPDDCGGQKNCTCFTIANFATGKYRITLDKAPINGFNVLVSPLSDARLNISVEKTSPTQLIVTTYDTVGAAYVDNALKDTYIQFMLWN